MSSGSMAAKLIHELLGSKTKQNWTLTWLNMHRSWQADGYKTRVMELQHTGWSCHISKWCYWRLLYSCE